MHLSRWRALLATLVAIALTAGLVVAIDDTDQDGRPEHITITIGDGQAKQKVVADRDNDLERDEQSESAAVPPAREGVDVHEDARDETPPGVPAASAQKGLEQQTAPGKGPARPTGGAQNYSCPFRPVRNYSSRNGQKVLLFVLHYTVSRPGSLDAIRGLFNTPSFGASSHLGIEFTGRCQQWVPFSAKAWTQGNFNGRAESVEIIATGLETRAQWLASPHIRRGILASLVRDRLRANGLPLRLVDPDGCDVQQAGFTDHNRLECGNSHHDVSPNFPMDVFVRQVRAGATSGKPVTATDRATCRKLNAYRRARARGGTSARRTQINVRRRQALERRKVVCTKTGPVRR